MKHKLKDGTTKPFSKGDQVIYIPKHLLSKSHKEMVQETNLGTVVLVNAQFVFVRYLNDIRCKATDPKDLYFIHGRPDLQEILNANVK